MRIKDKVAELADLFEKAGIESARADARILVAFALKQEQVYVRMHPEYEIEIDELALIAEFAQRRLKREPVSKIIGTKGFWRLDFKVTADVLDPRPDSETLIEEVLRIFPEKTQPLKILDLGTGTGCLALAVLCEYVNASAVGLDISVQALEIATQNAATNGLKNRFQVKQADWSQEGWINDLPAPFDIVISNPPYITEDERHSLAPEVLHYDPAVALFGGQEGMDAYYKIAEALPALLKKGGVCVLEFGAGQEEKVRQIISQKGLAFQSFGVDIAGITRCLSAVY